MGTVGELRAVVVVRWLVGYVQLRSCCVRAFVRSFVRSFVCSFVVLRPLLCCGAVLGDEFVVCGGRADQQCRVSVQCPVSTDLWTVLCVRCRACASSKLLFNLGWHGPYIRNDAGCCTRTGNVWLCCPSPITSSPHSSCATCKHIAKKKDY